MMVLSALRPDASLPEFLAHRARSASVHRLSIDLVIGVAGASAALSWRPSGWLVLTSAALVFFAYGGWGLGDRARSSKTAQEHRVLRGSMETVCALFGATGLSAAAALLYSVWAIALGTWIS
jgi:hypothetical protein